MFVNTTIFNVSSATVNRYDFMSLITEETYSSSSSNSSDDACVGDTGNVDGYKGHVGKHYIGARLDSLWSPTRCLFLYVSDGQSEWT